MRLFTNVVFVILDSKNYHLSTSKSIVVQMFDEICADPATLVEILLDYDCDISIVDLFHRIVNTLSRVSRTDMQESKNGGRAFGRPTWGSIREVSNGKL
jgi:Sec7-like guanine-nucleotide exchange factor